MRRGDLARTGGALPLLQLTAARLWDSRDRERRLLTEQSCRRLGGVAGTLASHADTVLAAMTGAEKALARALLLRLVTPERTRTLVSLGELRQLGGPDMERVLARLIDARLLMVEGSGADDAARPRTRPCAGKSMDTAPPVVRETEDYTSSRKEILLPQGQSTIG